MGILNPRVSLCMIVRDEEANLGDCLRCVEGMFHEIIIVDTGSTDRTKAIAQSFGATVVDFPWTEDFAAARNESRRRATGRWIFWLDADDRINAANRQRLQNVFDGLDAYDAAHNPVFMMSCISRSPDSRPDFGMSHARLFSANAAVEWKGRVHEHLACTTEGDVLNLQPTDVVIRHEGYSDPTEMSRKRFRDRRLLEREYLNNPDDPTTLFYLSRIYIAQDRPLEALRLARRAAALDPKGRLYITPSVYGIIVESLMKLDRVADAVEAAREGAARVPGDAGALYQLGSVLFYAGQLNESESCLRRVLELPKPDISVAGFAIGLDGATTRLTLGRLYLMQERWADADRELRQAIAAKPDCIDAWVALGFGLLKRGLTGEVLTLVRALEAYPGTAMERAMLRAQISIVKGEFQEARRWVRSAMAARPGAVEPWIILSDVLFQEGTDLQQCIDAHQKVLSIDPRQPTIRTRLEQILAASRNVPVHRQAAGASVLGSANIFFGV